MGENIKISYEAARVNANLTQIQAAEKLHVSRTTLQNWEQGKTEPKASNIKDMEEVYGIPAAFLFFYKR